MWVINNSPSATPYDSIPLTKFKTHTSKEAAVAQKSLNEKGATNRVGHTEHVDGDSWTTSSGVDQW